MKKSGFRFSSLGRGWDFAYERALSEVLAENGSKVILGPAIGKSGLDWLRRESLSRKPLLLGEHFIDWKTWVTSRAREYALENSLDFHVLNVIAEREQFRQVLKIGINAGAFQHLPKLVEDREFFEALFELGRELRMAGVKSEPQIERARELLLKEGTLNSHQELWDLMLLWEVRIRQEGFFDFAALLELATLSTKPTPILLVGFERFSLLEVELLQSLARITEVEIVFDFPTDVLRTICQGKVEEERIDALALRALATNFSGSIEFIEAPLTATPERFQSTLAVAHEPAMEARAAGKLCHLLVQQQKTTQVVTSKQYFAQFNAAKAFEEESFASGIYPDTLERNPIFQAVLQGFQLKKNDYDKNSCSDFARALSAVGWNLSHFSSELTKQGIRKGLAEWLRKSTEPLQEFVSLLVALEKLIPEQGTGADFVEILDRVLELTKFGLLTKSVPHLASERAAHMALAALLRNAQMIATSTLSLFTLDEWLQEILYLMAQSSAEEPQLPAQLRMSSLGQWLAPGVDQVLVLGFDSSIESQMSFSYFLSESERRRLSEFLLYSKVQVDLTTLRQCAKLRELEQTIFSRTHFSCDGAEVQSSWMETTLDLHLVNWPDCGPILQANDWSESRSFQVQGVAQCSFSATLFDTYKDCPFKAFLRSLLRLDDSTKEPSLDVSALDEGGIVHRVLELYYKEHNGRYLSGADAVTNLQACMESSFSEKQIKYYKGNESLLAYHKKKVFRFLRKFLEADREYYAQFSELGSPLCEVSIKGDLGFAYTGKVDRIDLDPQRKKMLLVDYKLGSQTPATGEILALEKFQVPLYWQAVQKMFPDYEVVGGTYLSLKTHKRNQGLVNSDYVSTSSKPSTDVKYIQLTSRTSARQSKEAIEQTIAASRDEMNRLVEKIQSGDFPVYPRAKELCERCEYQPACRLRNLSCESAVPENHKFSLDDFSVILAKKPREHLEAERKLRAFNEAQKKALSREGKFTFIEASAGTGKTTVIVERVRLYLLSAVQRAPFFQAIESFLAISFTDKSVAELAERLGHTLFLEPGFGAKAAAQAQQQISTIHGLCRKIIADFPLEAGINPLAKLIDEKAALELRMSAMEELFLAIPEDAREDFELLFSYFSRKKIEQLVLQLSSRELLDRELHEALKKSEFVKFTFPTVAPHQLVLTALSRSLAVFTQIYQKKKDELSVLDFSDLERLSLKALAVETVRLHYQKKYDLILVDEFQDTNTVQREIIDALTRPGRTNLFVVGDAKQSIYRFRNADVAVFSELKKQAEEKDCLVSLQENYRSRAELVEAANAISHTMFDSESPAAFEAVAMPSVPKRPAGGTVEIWEYDLGEERKTTAAERREFEANQVVRIIQERLAKGRRPSEIAILFRKISGNDIFLTKLREAAIPFAVSSSSGFFEQGILLDAVTLLRALEFPESDVALFALLRSPWLRMKAQEIYDFSRERKGAALQELLPEEFRAWLRKMRRQVFFQPYSALLLEAFSSYPHDLSQDLQVKKLIHQVAQLERAGHAKASIIDELSAAVGFTDPNEMHDERTMPTPGGADAVQILTVHAAKGLEFPTVILPDLDAASVADRSPLRILAGSGMVLKLEDDESAPVEFTQLDEANKVREKAELKRLFYVAITRAQEEEIFLCKKAETEKKNTWGDFLRATDLTRIATKHSLVWGTAQEAAKAESSQNTALRTAPLEEISFRDPSPALAETSVSEMAAYLFCGEFHRLKFVQKWDDRVVSLWPAELKAKKKSQKVKSSEQLRLEKLLRKLGIEKKERGIALHRVLERIAHSFSQVKIWLRDAYLAQGVSPFAEELKELLELDVTVLTKFLASHTGQELFSPEVKAYPEIVFQWKQDNVVIHGTMDRLIEKGDGSYLVVDYKSSVLEESLDRYRFQVGTYMLAIQRSTGKKVSGALVDLFSSEVIPVSVDADEFYREFEVVLQQLKKNYLLTSEKLNLNARGVSGGDHCFSCPYSQHCEIGRKSVLA